MNTSRLLELSIIIQNSVEIIHNHLSLNSLPFPTFDKRGFTSLPDNLSAAKDAVLDASAELHDLLMAPIDLVATIANVSPLPICNQYKKEGSRIVTCQNYMFYNNSILIKSLTIWQPWTRSVDFLLPEAFLTQLLLPLLVSINQPYSVSFVVPSQCEFLRNLSKELSAIQAFLNLLLRKKHIIGSKYAVKRRGQLLPRSVVLFPFYYRSIISNFLRRP